GKAEPVGAQANILLPAISPDEKMVAFSKLAASGNRDIWLRDLVRGTERRLTIDPSVNIVPFWSPKTGDRILFRSNRNNHPGDLYRRPSAGGAKVGCRLTNFNMILEKCGRRAGGFFVYAGGDQKTKHALGFLPRGKEGNPPEKRVASLPSDLNEL